jgi:hypothetical protein
MMILDKIKGSRAVNKFQQVWSIGIKCNVCGDPGVLYVRGTLDEEGHGAIDVKLADNLKDGYWQEVLFE